MKEGRKLLFNAQLTVAVISGRASKRERLGGGGGGVVHQQTHMGCSPASVHGLSRCETSSDESTTCLLHQLAANFKGLWVTGSSRSRYI